MLSVTVISAFFITVIISGQSNLTCHCRRRTVRQVVPLCPAMWAHWCHLANVIEVVLWPTQVHNPICKLVRSAISAQLTAESPYALQWAPLSPKIALPMGHLDPPTNTWFLETIHAHNPNSISIGSTVFAQLSTDCPYTLQWDAPSPPSKLPLPTGESGPRLIHGSLGPPEFSN